MKKLPDVPSALIKLALEDLRKAEQSPDYVVDMRYWHKPSKVGGRCSVCLAGAVMAFTLSASKNEIMTPDVFDEKLVLLKLALLALNAFRSGSVRNGCGLMGCVLPPTLESRSTVADYALYRDGFYADMTLIADRLEGVGL